MAGLAMLKHTFNLSDGKLYVRWGEPLLQRRAHPLAARITFRDLALLATEVWAEIQFDCVGFRRSQSS